MTNEVGTYVAIYLLDRQLHSLTHSSSSFICTLTQLDTAKDLETTFDVLKQQLSDLTSAKDALTVQGKKDTMEIAAQKKQFEESVAQQAALAKDYQTYKSTSEKTVSDLNASLSKVKDEYAQHLKECKLAADKAAKTIEDLQTQLKKSHEEITNQIKTIAELNANKVRLEAANKQQAEEHNSLVEKFNKLTENMAKCDKELEAKSGELASLTKQHSDLSASTTIARTTAEKVIQDLKGQLASSVKSVGELEISLKKSNEEITEQVKTIAELNANKQRLESTNKQQAEEIARLKQALATLTAAKQTGNNPAYSFTSPHFVDNLFFLTQPRNHHSS